MEASGTLCVSPRTLSPNTKIKKAVEIRFVSALSTMCHKAFDTEYAEYFPIKFKEGLIIIC